MLVASSTLNLANSSAPKMDFLSLYNLRKPYHGMAVVFLQNILFIWTYGKQIWQNKILQTFNKLVRAVVESDNKDPGF